MAKKKYYVVWEGHNPGIYDSWAECQKQIKNFPGARYKSFKTREEADDALYGNSSDYIGKNKKPATIPDKYSDDIVWDSISVDAACSGNPGAMEYRGVDTKTGFEIFRKGPFQKGTNNIGEFLALVHGLALLKKEGREIPIYSDSRIAIGWVKKKSIRTQLERSAINEKMFQLVERAEKWLKTNDYDTEILKWDTKNWGEIPADFGRK
ncbi:MAG: ribonuclease H family protein [Bacteroidota bacterium]